MIRINTKDEKVEATFALYGTEVRASGDTLTEAVQNLVRRFKELQEMALEELHSHGFIAVSKEFAS